MPKTPANVSLFNTMTRSVDVFETLEDGKVGIYCCGPTVYNYQHIGNLRTYIFEDVLVRMLRYAGYEVNHVMNITDVGHLVSDADEGEDKMSVAAKREGKSSMDIAAYYTDVFFDHCEWLNIIRPDVVCAATEHIQQMIELIQKIEENGYAYVTGGNVYFDVAKFSEYGKLAGLDLEQLQAGARIEVDSNKRSPQDFVLWFTKSKFENQELQWDSPWGRGYPGWHIECSAMARAYLGDHFDIHCGGIDHVPVHHTNEIAQSESATGKTFSNWWMHGGFLVSDKAKMSKSTGEFLKLDVLTERGHDPIAYRLFCLGGTYRNELAWSFEALEGSANSLKKIKAAVISWKQEAEAAESLSAASEKHLETFETAIFEDLAMPRALAAMHGVISDAELPSGEKLALLLRFDTVLGLGIDSWEFEQQQIPDAVLALAKQRDAARQEKNWAEADRLRDEIVSQGFLVEDSTDGTQVKKQ